MVLSWLKASLSLKAWCCDLQFPIFYCSGALAMIHLSCRTIPLLSVSQPQYICAINLLSLTLTGSHRQMCPCLRWMLVWSYQLDVYAWYLWFTRHDQMMNSSFNLYASTKQPSRTIIYSGNGHSTVPASFSRAMLLLGSFSPQHVCSRLNLPTELILSCQLHLSHWHIASCNMYVLRCQAQWRTAVSDIISFDKRSQVICCCQPPNYFLYTQDQKHPFWDQLCWGTTEDWADLVWQWHVLCLVCLLCHCVIDILCHWMPSRDHLIT